MKGWQMYSQIQAMNALTIVSYLIWSLCGVFLLGLPMMSFALSFPTEITILFTVAVVSVCIFGLFCRAFAEIIHLLQGLNNMSKANSTTPVNKTQL